MQLLRPGYQEDLNRLVAEEFQNQMDGDSLVSEETPTLK